MTINFPRQELIYAPAEITWVDHESRLITASTHDSAVEAIAWLADPGLVAGDSYQVHAMIANPSVEELRAAGTHYPKWVTDRYLQIPQRIEPQLKELAERIAGAYISPYDKAQAITVYLRKEIKYTTQLAESPPSFEDPLIWVLFKYKKGFCMYYASAETLMLRTLGIPARMAAGFAEGEFETEKNRYTVAQLDSHAWPEVYFPDIGWVEFEPTGNQDPLNRPQEADKENTASADQNDRVNNNAEVNIDEGPLNPASIDPTLLEEENLPVPSQNNPLTRFLNLVLPMSIFAFGIFIIRHYSLGDRLPVYLANRYKQNGSAPPLWLEYWARWANLSPIERSFQAINFSLYWMGHAQPIYVTSQERAQALITHLPSAKDQTLLLLHEYQTIIYTPRTGNIPAARKAALAILLKACQTRIKKTL